MPLDANTFPNNAMRLDWQICHKVMVEAQKRLEMGKGRGPARHSWMDGAIGIAEEYSRKHTFPLQMHVHPTSFQATDNVILKRQTDELLLVRKAQEPLWRFPGGFVDPKDTSLEYAAARERQEELGIDLECSRPKYLFSFRVPDPRYVGKPDKIMSAVFSSEWMWGAPVPSDDLKGGDALWVNREYILDNYDTCIMPCHRPLVILLKGYVL